MRHIPIMDFRSVEEAIKYAHIYTPYRQALADFQNRDLYGYLYGDKAKNLAMQCWEAANKNDTRALLNHTHQLNAALPKNVFGTAGERR